MCIASRWDKRKLRKEFFEYDDLDRLTQAEVFQTTSNGGLIYSDAPPITYAYDGSVGGTTMGNLKQRTDIGKFGTTAVHRIAQATGPDYPFPYDDPPLAITPGPQAITYTSYHQPASLSETIDGTSYLLEYTYDADQQRNYSKLRNMTTQSTVEERWYEHGLETQRLNGQASTDRKILYVQGGDGLCAMIVAETGGAQTAYAVYKDHLGSIVAVTKHTFSSELLGGGSSGIPEIIAEQNFDAWGRKRNPATWTYVGLPVLPSWLYRGYTGHEHIEPFTLINMNGRLYDPLNGRMLSADNYVQGGLGTQGYNRYSYAGNNPLKYTDPEGEWVHLVIGAVIGGTLNWLANGGQFDAQGLGYFATGAVAGALAAGVGAGVGAALVKGGASFGAGFIGTTSATTLSGTGFAAGFVSGAASGVTNGLISGTGNQWLSEGNLGNAFVKGGLDQAWKQGIAGGLVGGIVGGIDAVSHKGNFWNGGVDHRAALQLDPKGKWESKFGAADFEKGPNTKTVGIKSITDGNNLSRYYDVTNEQWTTTIKMPRALELEYIRINEDAINLMSPEISGRIMIVKSVERINSLTIIGKIPYGMPLINVADLFQGRIVRNWAIYGLSGLLNIGGE